MTDGVSAIILAGGRNSPAMEQATGETNRALVRLGDRTMLGHIAGALQEATTVGRLYAVGDVPDDDSYTRVPGGATLMDNLLAGLATAQQDRAPDRVLVSAADIPFLTAAAVDDFVTRARATGADLCYPIIPIARCREQYPGTKRTTLKLREGTFTGGNLFLLDPRAILERRALVERAYAARKSVPQMGRLLGWGLLARVVVSQILSSRLLTLPPLEAGVGRLLGGCRAAAVITDYPEIGTDVDRPEDVVAAQTILAPSERTSP